MNEQFLRLVVSYRLKNGPHKNTVRELASEPQHTSKKNSKNTHIRLTTLPRSPWRRTTLCHHPLEDAREAHRRPRITPPRHSFSNHTARYSLFLMNMRAVLHHSGYFAVPIDALSFNPFRRRYDHESGAGHFARRAHLNSFFLMRKKLKHYSI